MTLKKASHEHVARLMQQAEAALVGRSYFLCERLCVEALGKALASDDYASAARIINPLQEARRHKRDLAWDTGVVRMVHEPLGEHFKPEAGVYFLVPPRVGSEARSIRATADQCEVPVIVVAREPMTGQGPGQWAGPSMSTRGSGREADMAAHASSQGLGGRCPVVAVGPVTVRAFVAEPGPVLAAPAAATGGGKGRKKQAALNAEAVVEVEAVPGPVVNAFGTFHRPSMQWILAAGEALGDAAIAQVSVTDPLARVEQLMLRLAAHSDHEKLHQRLREACEEAARLVATNPAAARAARRGTVLPDDDGEGLDLAGEGEGEAK
jgi:hypothetical protein